MKNLAQLYSLSICFISTIIILFTLILMVQDIISLTFFDFKHKVRLSSYTNNIAYLDSLNDNQRDRLSMLSDNQITDKRIEKMNEYKVNEKYVLLNDITSYSLRIIVSFIFLIIHFKIYKRSSKV